MQILDLETSAIDFLALGRRLLSFDQLTAEQVLGEFIAWYTNTRIAGALLAEDGDMLLLEWGETQPFDLKDPADLRRLKDDPIRLIDEYFPYLDFTRQVFVNNEEKSLEFDDVAVQMRVTLFYEQSVVSESGSSIWIDMPGELHSKLEKYRATPFVIKMLGIPASRVNAIVDHCG